MKRIHCQAWSLIAVLLLALPMLAQQEPLNPKAVALLRWYPANLTTSYSVGHHPEGVAFDGANMWVTNYNDNTVSKLRASDGTHQGTFPVGEGPFGVAFDGANIWVVNKEGNSVTKLRASDGTNLGTFPVGVSPWDATFDGANIWVTNGQSQTVSKLRASSGAKIQFGHGHNRDAETGQLGHVRRQFAQNHGFRVRREVGLVEGNALQHGASLFHFFFEFRQ